MKLQRHLGTRGIRSDFGSSIWKSRSSIGFPLAALRGSFKSSKEAAEFLPHSSATGSPRQCVRIKPTVSTGAHRWAEDDVLGFHRAAASVTNAIHKQGFNIALHVF